MNASQSTWFLNDQAVFEATQDTFGHDNVAEQIVHAATELEAPVTIGLIGGFGTGKTTIAHLAMSRLKRSYAKHYDAVRVTVDRHGGSARARSIVHSVGSELAATNKIKRSDFEAALRPLKSSVRVSTEAPEHAPIWHAFRDQTTRRRIIFPALGLALLFVVALILGYSVEDTAQTAVWGTGLAILIVGLAFILHRVYKNWILDLFKSARVEDSTPRAESSDDVERIFSKVINAHHKETLRRLIIFVDDVDRLDPDDVLEALRSIKTLQAVPRGIEPVFVIACDDQIVHRAIQDAQHAPSPDTRINEDIKSGKADAAKAFLDKFFSLRIVLPLHLAGDMRDYAEKIIRGTHPARKLLGGRLSSCLAILLYEVDNPRSVIRRLNYYFSALMLATSREDAQNSTGQRIQKGDITNHPELLARLVILRTEFPEFYYDVSAEHRLLEAASKFLLNETLDVIQLDLLNHSHWVEPRHTSPSDASSTDEVHLELLQSDLQWKPEYAALRRFLLATAHRIRHYPASLTPFMHMTHSTAGRLAGSQRLTELLGAVRDGDISRIETELEDSPVELQEHFAKEIVEVLDNASAVDAPGLLVGAAGAASFLQRGSDLVSNAAAGLLSTHSDVHARAADTIVFLEHADDSLSKTLRNRLVRDASAEETLDNDNQMKEVAQYYIPRRTVEDLLPPLRRHLQELAHEGTWIHGREWLDLAEQAVEHYRYDLINRDILPAVVQLVSADPSVTSADADRFLTLVTTPEITAESLERNHILAVTDGTNPILNKIFIELYAQSELELDKASASIFAKVLQTDLTSSEVATSLRILSSHPEAWIDAEAGRPEKEEDSNNKVASLISSGLAHQLNEQYSGIAGPAADFLRRVIPAASEEFSEVVHAILSSIYDENKAWNQELPRVLAELLDELPNTDADATANSFLSPFFEDEYSQTAQNRALDCIPLLAESSRGREELDAAATSWRNALATTPSDPLALDAFQRLGICYAQAIEAQAPQLVGNIDSLVRQSKDIENAMRVAVKFPWPDETLASLVTIFDEHWDKVPAQLTGEVIEIVAHSYIVHETVPETLRDRLLETAVQSPEASELENVAKLWPFLSTNDRTRLLIAGISIGILPISPEELSNEEIRTLLYEAAHRDNTSTVLEVLPPALVQTPALECLEGLLSDARPFSLAQACQLVEVLTDEQINELLSLVMKSHETAGAEPVAAARILRSLNLKTEIVGIELIEEWLLQNISSDMNVETAREMGGLLEGVTIPRQVKNLLASLTKEIKTEVAEFQSAAKPR